MFSSDVRDVIRTRSYTKKQLKEAADSREPVRDHFVILPAR